MLGTRQLARVLEVAEKARTKVVLVADPEQLQTIEAGAPFRGIAAAHGVAELAEVHRQRQDWQRAATTALATGKTAEALTVYAKEGASVAVQRRESARNALLTRWARDATVEPDGSRLMLAYTREDVRALNASARAWRRQRGQLGPGHAVATAAGSTEFAVQDRVRFLRKDKALGVKNGSLGTVQGIEAGVLSIKLDGGEAAVAIDTKFYKHLEHGYASTVRKAQGSTVDRAYVLATSHFDRHTAYVALSRHREAVTVFYAADDFGGRGGGADAEVQGRFVERLSRVQAKDLAHDYLERKAAVEPEVLTAVPELIRPLNTEEIRARARQRWVEYRARMQNPAPAAPAGPGQDRGTSEQERGQARDDDFSL